MANPCGDLRMGNIDLVGAVLEFSCPMWLEGITGVKTSSNAFPEGTIVPAIIAGGWFWPLIIVSVRAYKDSDWHRKHMGR
jgi:hypothetical protein